ncbi:malto-oligosyltrehalose synthase [Gemmatirosa kalamazoonensis]|uniref:Malto-oligosyltrehalose synthase n=1 Tax=Gemmatirosa kalamazoonensis TaxID=861299 RepID=W0RLM3_9BACT|nr:malto-oligosyltrehalose synthase [Gemmatirosa kalamazoonensis]
MTAVPNGAPPLTATYRLQLHAGFGFDDARAIVPYVARLGASHLYLSPVTAARPGSRHGYDVADPRAANPELGGDAAFRALCDAAHAEGLGVLVDIVPNHMGVGPANPFWMDVLRWGRDSRFAGVFDVDWSVPGREGLLVLPVLGDDLAAVLDRRELKLDWRDDEFRFVYFEHEWPVDPRTVHRVFAFEHTQELSPKGRNQVVALRDALFPEGGASLDEASASRAAQSLADAVRGSAELRAYVDHVLAQFADGEAGRYRVEALLQLQNWRAVHWRRGPREINYRRFFDIGELAAVRAEDPAVFAVTHQWILDRVAEGLVDGLRVDHVDGLRDPRGYLERLRGAVDERRPGEALPILVEKILSPDEHLPPAWTTDGTTGYEYLNDLESVFVDPDGAAALEAAYRKLLRLRTDRGGFHDVAARGKEHVLRHAFDTDVRRLVRHLERAARGVAPRLPRAALQEAVVQTIVGLPVYRTYLRVGDDGTLDASPEDFRWIGETLARAFGHGAADRFALQFVADVLRGEWSGKPDVSERARRAAAEFVLRFQQTSGPATAKGVEDTALYRWFPLASLCEVGGEPSRPLADAVGRLHAGNVERLMAWPRQLLAVETHDTKRSADVRARLDALSEIAPEWTRLVARWRRRHAPLHRLVNRRGAPDANAEYLLYQTLVGVWPLGGPADDAERASLKERVTTYMRKAAREAKAQTSWTDADAQYEQGLDAFVAALVEGQAGDAFREELGRLVEWIARAGWWTSLARTVIQTASPGTPDTYQGGELWALALVDPDNRRPVDFARRAELLDALDAEDWSAPDAAAARLLDGPGDGRLKLHVLRTMLRLRREEPALFAAGAYRPIEVIGAAARHVVAFAREGEGRGLVVVAPRLPLGLRRDGAIPVGSAVWGDTTLLLPESAGGRRVLDRFTGTVHTPDGARLGVGVALGVLPVACLAW